MSERRSSDGKTEVRARFTAEPGAPTGKPQASPLLSSTPPTVAKSLVKSYPYLLIVNKALSIFTWTNDDYWVNLIIVCMYSLLVVYFENIITWSGHLVVVAILALYALLNHKITQETTLKPTLDDVVQALTTTCIKADMLLDPITSLALSAHDIKRLLFTTVFLTPLYLIVTLVVIPPRTILLVVGVYLLTYHSVYMRVTRRIIWKLKIARLICFYLTGLDFQNRNHIFAAAFAKVQKGNTNNGLGDPNKPVRFAYVVYENQRRWLGIGWTANLLSYERAPWTDEFLNESPSVDKFELPSPDNDYSSGSSAMPMASGATWRWVDKSWRLDLTNDGAITLNKRSKTTADPGPDEGFIYYDNVWKKPSTEDSYSKYTRRRRWVRTAELTFAKAGTTEKESEKSIDIPLESSDQKSGKKLRFAESDVSITSEVDDDAIHASLEDEKSPLVQDKKND